MDLETHPKTAHRLRGRSLFLISLSAFIILCFGMVYAYYNGVYDMASPADKMALKGEIEVKIDGKTIFRNHNVIFLAHYDYISCKLYNQSCTVAGLTPGYNVATNLMDSAGLSTDSTTPVAGSASCSGLITTSGLERKKADSISHSANSISNVLTWTWTATATVNNVQKVCLYDRWTNNDTYVGPFAASLFTAANVQLGQSISVQWTFTY